MNQIVINGDNIELLKKYPDNYFDAVVTDPPYGLGKEPNAEELMKDWVEKGYHEISGKGFMGKEWDAFIPQPVFWKEVFRVLKHGGHVLSFFGTRTYDWGVMSMRFAGFEVRDCIQWLYGSGFPKSHNISKALDKMGGQSLEWFIEYILEVAKERGISKKELTMLFPSKNGNPTGWIWNKQNNQSITLEQYNKIKEYLNLPFENIEEAEREFIGKGKAGLTKGDIANFSGETEFDITAPSTESAKQWDGWGTALKPANEPIVLARKPLEKGLSIAENILKWGVGGINIDASRVVSSEDMSNIKAFGSMPQNKSDNKGFSRPWMNDKESILEKQNAALDKMKNLGRFPANIILTHHEDCECKGTKKVKAIKGGVGEKSKISNGIINWKPSNIGGKGDADGNETIEDWICVEGGKLIAPCLYINGYEISIFNFREFDVIQQHREFYHNSEAPYSHNKDKYNFLDCETFHDLGWKQLPSFRVDYPFLSHFYDALVQTFQVYDQLSFQQLNDALYVVHHFLELLHNHLHLDHDPPSKQNDSLHDSLAQHILQNKAFYSLFLKKISYHNSDILFQELAKNDVLDSTCENNIFEDFLSYLTKMGLNNSSILHLHQMLFCLSLQINFNQIYYKEFELPTCPIRILDEQSGVRKSEIAVKRNLDGRTYNKNQNWGLKAQKKEDFGYTDKGGASRFFYVAKASKAERNKGLEGFEEKRMEGRDEGQDERSVAFKARPTPMANVHPTVKPVKLMQYLVKMITPPNGIVLDPFCGSGTTGVACKLDGFQFVGLEQDPEYAKIAEARINNYNPDIEISKKQKPNLEQIPLF